jgi:hypothetical protein
MEFHRNNNKLQVQQANRPITMLKKKPTTMVQLVAQLKIQCQSQLLFHNNKFVRLTNANLPIIKQLKLVCNKETTNSNKTWILTLSLYLELIPIKISSLVSLKRHATHLLAATMPEVYYLKTLCRCNKIKGLNRRKDLCITAIIKENKLRLLASK